MPFVLALIFGIVGVVGGIIVRTTGQNDPRQEHRLATAYAGLLFMLGLVLVVIWSVLGLGNIAPLTLLLAFAFPAALAVILWGTPAVREYFRTLPEGDRSGRYSFAGIPRTAKERREPVGSRARARCLSRMRRPTAPNQRPPNRPVSTSSNLNSRRRRCRMRRRTRQEPRQCFPT